VGALAGLGRLGGGGPWVLGVDGCPGGWLAARLSAAAISWSFASSVRELPGVVGSAGRPGGSAAAAVAIDIPIGLPDAGPRTCDLLARRRLGSRGVCVFPAPPRAVLDAGDYTEARARSRALQGRSLSLQAWNIVPRISDVDRVVGPADESRIVECHPELAFARRAGVVLPGKRTTEGRRARLAVLAGALPGSAEVLAEALAAAPRPARSDDAADALVCALVAAAWLDGDAEVLPEEPERDRRGLAMRIVC
jgi:predicted RNase H-like nuclease